jgi:ABC-type bacteriocin/lantibiotic exporter with double-glycine peptidase domain
MSAHLLLYGCLVCGSAAAAPEVGPGAQELPDCGAASVYAILKLHGRPEPLSRIEARFLELSPGANLKRLSLLELRKCIESFGLHAASIQVAPGDLASTPTPAIIFIPFRKPEGPNADDAPGHFLVLHRVNGGSAELIDVHGGTSRSRFTVPLAQLGEVWNGVALVVSTEPIEAPPFALGRGLTISLCSLTAAAILLAFCYLRGR